MTSDYLKRKIGGAILSFSMLFAIAMALSVTAQAQYPQYPQYPNEQDRRDRDRDWRRNRDRDQDRDRDRDRNGDWNRDRDWNRNRDYRNGRGGYGNSYRFAMEQGYRDGFYTGQSDAQRGQSYNPQRSHYYRSGTDGYDRSYGNRDAYRQAFRDGFLRGYDEGFRRYRGYNRGNNRGGNNGRWFPY